MKINTILQIVALVFLVIIGYISFNSGSNWKIIKSELDRAREELKISKDTLAATKINLQKSLKEINKLKLQKDLVTHKRDSLLLDFGEKNAIDWDHKMKLQDSLKKIQDKITVETKLLDSLFGL
ncbi:MULTISPECIES: hypothetical protein [Aquimarina]|uniref:Uncharacterized protein n=1 Tax=Aquimarina algiphila TaxID=2047982 RepID=A0A554VK02_9FLAO|nr:MULTISPECIES: hypothetical protein [Aquimarina]TSE08292.1 hypothetical protein FOF46_12915 [Aquimarina algiphila]